MINDNKNNPTGQSRDAVRHEQDALHHKFHKSPLPASGEEENDVQPSAAEIPQVGSRDAPGG